MALNDRNPAAGTQLAARYKKELYRCTVVETEGGLRFRLYDFSKVETGYQRQTGSTVDFKTPSAAGAAVLGGMACNGWRFWSLASELEAPKERKQAAVAPTAPVAPAADPADDAAGPEGEAAHEATVAVTGPAVEELPEPAVDETPEPVHDEQNPKALRIITRMKAQGTIAEGLVRYWCRAAATPSTTPRVRSRSTAPRATCPRQ